MRYLNTIMKRTILLLFFSFLAQISFAQVSNSVLATGDWYKFSVDTTGVFKIDRNLLQQIGIFKNGLNPKKIHIYGNGGTLLPTLNSSVRYNDLQENTIYIEGENDGSFDSNDFILFYAKGPHDWQVNTTSETATHRQNIYTDKAYYFITVNNDDGKRIQQKTPITTSANTQITTFDDFIFFEKEERNLFAVGTQWFFNEDFNVENTQEFEIPFPNFVPSENISVRVRGVAASVSASSMAVTVNNQNLYTINYSGVSAGGLTKANAQERTASLQNSLDKIAISITYANGGNPSAKAYLDFIEIVGKKQLIVNENQFSFRSFTQANTTGIVEYQLQNNTNIFQLWDVSNHLEPKNIINEDTGSNFSFKDNAGLDVNGNLKEYIVLNEKEFYIPETLQDAKVNNQNLHALQDINYLVITNSDFSNEAQRLADYHQTNSNLTAKVVLVDEIYNEFSSGAKDITGIRDFIKHLYTTNSSVEKKLQYVCFFGDTSYDYKDRISGNNNIVPAKLPPLELKNDTLSIKTGYNNYQYIRTKEFQNLCQKSKKDNNDPMYNFEVFTETYKNHYAFFDLNKIQWDSMYNASKKRLKANATDVELYIVLQEMMDRLNDNHGAIEPSNEVFALSNVKNTQEEDDEHNEIGDLKIAGLVAKHYIKEDLTLLIMMI